MEEEPIATYEEKHYGVRRRFELFRDHCRVTGRSRTVGQFDENISLATLQPRPSRLWRRNATFRFGLTALFSAAAVVVGVVLRVRAEESINPAIVVVAGLATVIGLWLVLANIRPIEIVRFRSDAGVYALDIFRAGP